MVSTYSHGARNSPPLMVTSLIVPNMLGEFKGQGLVGWLACIVKWDDEDVRGGGKGFWNEGYINTTGVCFPCSFFL